MADLWVVWVLTMQSQLVLDSSLRQAAELAVLARLARSEAQRIPGPAAHAARESASLPMDQLTWKAWVHVLVLLGRTNDLERRLQGAILVPGTPGTLGRADHVAQRRRAERVRGKADLWAVVCQSSLLRSPRVQSFRTLPTPDDQPEGPEGPEGTSPGRLFRSRVPEVPEAPEAAELSTPMVASSSLASRGPS